MQSPPRETALLVGYLAALNLLRNSGDPDNDTWSEQTRIGITWLEDHGLPGGLLFDLGLALAAYGFRQHIRRPRWAKYAV